MAILGRSQPFHPHVAPAIVAAAPARSPLAPAVVVTAAARARMLVGRTVPRPHAPSPIVSPGGPVSVVGRRTQIGDVATRNATYLAGSGRTLLFRPHLARPIVATASVAPLAPGVLITTTARQRMLVGRTVSHPHVSPATLAPPPFPPAKVVGQAQRRMLVGRSSPRAHTAGPNLAQPPFPPLLVISQAQRRPLLARAFPRPHLAPPIVAAASVPSALPPAILITAMARARMYLGRIVFRPHLASPIVAVPPVLGPGTFRYQATSRSVLRPRPPLPHLAAPNLAPSPFRPAVFISQAQRRPFLGRTCPRAHLPGPNLTPPGFGPARFVGQARQRMLVGRTCPHPHLVGPNLTPPTPAPVVGPGTFHYQATSRSVRRPRPPAPHLAPALVGAPPPPPPKTTPGFQAIRRTTYVQVTRHDPGADGEKATRDRQIVKRYWDRR